jgi:hypothetical protein
LSTIYALLEHCRLIFLTSLPRDAGFAHNRYNDCGDIPLQDIVLTKDGPVGDGELRNASSVGMFTERLAAVVNREITVSRELDSSILCVPCCLCLLQCVLNREAFAKQFSKLTHTKELNQGEGESFALTRASLH